MKESFRQNIKNVGVGIAATVASVGIPKDAVAQHGLFGRIKDKVKEKVEFVENKIHETKQEIKSEASSRPNEVHKLNIPWEGDKIGFDYPFEKEYKSDENFYRDVRYRTGYSMNEAKELAIDDFVFKIMEEKTNHEVGTFSYDIKSLPRLLEPSKYKYDENTRIYTVVVAVEIPKDEIVITSKVLKDKTLNSNSEKSLSSKIEETPIAKSVKNSSKDLQEYKVEKPTPPPIGNKPEKQPIYTPAVEKSDYHATFEDFQKAQKSDLDAFEKAKEQEFNKFKEEK